jgi:acetyl-CoA carboxylase biotin carboxyl carrier protein
MTMADIIAHITGTIFKIEKRLGDSVAAGDEVIILESMKMEIPLESPVAGVVQQILVAEGQVVEEGALVAVVA